MQHLLPNLFKKIPSIEKINNIIWEKFTCNVTLEELVWIACDTSLTETRLRLRSSLVDELFSVHKSTEKNDNPREIVGNQGQTRERERAVWHL